MSSMVETEYAVGEQNDAIRKQFCFTGYTQCPRCQSENIAVHFWCCGRELNGDGKYKYLLIKVILSVKWSIAH